MKLTDQEQVILKAIGPNVAEVSRVIRSVGYPKATVKKVLVRLSEKGIVALYRHDWPASLRPEQRKFMVRHKGNYYNAVSVMKRNPKSKGRTALKKTGRALKGFAKGALSAGAQILGAGAEALNPGRRRNAESVLTEHDKKQALQIWDHVVSQGPYKFESQFRAALDRHMRAFGHGSGSVRQADMINYARRIRGNQWRKGLNPVRRKIRNKYIDLVIKGQAKKTPQGWKVGKKTFAQGRGTVSVSSGYYLDKHTGLVYAKRERNIAAGAYYDGAFHPYRSSPDYDPAIAGETGRKPRRTKSKKKRAAVAKAIKTASHKKKISSRRATKKSLAGRSLRRTTSTGKRLKRKRNIEKGFYDSTGFHPQRESKDYDPAIAGETGGKPRRTRSKKRAAAKRKAAATHRARSMVRRRKATTSRLAGRSLKKSSGLLKKRRKRNNPSAESIRKEFAGSVSGERDLFFPQGTPSGKLAKLGKLVSITTEEGTIKPVSGTAWLCADTRGKLHIGSTSGAPLFDGPKRSFGHVTKLEYESTKPHLGYKGPIIWFHRAGEENGIRPTLHADGKGGIVFRGGDYRLTRRGIEN